jgi:peptidoglycan/xylan/chitin deacetylase (PgdA/CDA1 family)
MKRKQKLYIALVAFITLAITGTFFVLLDLNKPKTINKHQILPNGITANDIHKEKESETDLNKNTKSKSKEGIDWQPIIEKWKGKEVSKIKTDRKIIALTFDAGANAGGVDKILEILEKENIKGTFFLTGKFIEKYPSEVQKIILSEGDLGNHSYSHPHFTQISSEKITHELEKTEELISKLGAEFKPIFRFPYGDRNSRTIKIINDKNYVNIKWTIDSFGWKGISGGMTKESVKNRVLSRTTPGTIIMMHLGSNPNDKTHLDSEALPEIIQELKNQKYEFVTLTEMLNPL